MGLDTTHGAWNGGYGSFNLWRQCIANYYGVPLELMEGYWSMSGSAECLIKDKMGTASWFDKYERVLPLKWESFKLPNSVKYLLNHSDCDGHIPPKTCGKLAKELNKALPNLKSTKVYVCWRSK